MPSCNCQRYCRGQAEVSRATYTHHAQYRHQLATALSSYSEDNNSYSDDTSQTRELHSADTNLHSGRDPDGPPPKKRQRLDETQYRHGSTPDAPTVDEPFDDPPSGTPDDQDLDTDSDDSGTTPSSAIEDLQIALDFIEAIKNASLDNGDLDPETLARLRHPPEEILDLSDPALRYSLDLFLATTHASKKAYTDSRTAYLRRHPDNEVLSLTEIKRKVAE
ncbi:hypothetical protein B0H10DRAFT_1808959, partial [Mycena sp. CBHHK59/15]